MVDGPVGPGKNAKMGKVAYDQYSIDRSLKFFCANFRLPTEGTLAPIGDRLEVITIPAASAIDQTRGEDEISRAASGIDDTPARKVFTRGHERIANNSYRGLCLEHLIVKPPTDM